MDININKWKRKRDFTKLLHCREINSKAGKLLKQSTQFTDSLIKRLGLEFELEGHQGCVNCLQWTADGKFLASGSDDTNVILWDPFRHKKLQVVPTHHIGNIFSVKFLGTNNSIIVTAAGDCRVQVQNIENSSDKNSPILECCCHSNRVKRLTTTIEEPTLFWSGGEDGYIMQYDLREPHDCSINRNVLICLASQSEIKCITINPTQPHYMAVGVNDCYVRMYDRRMLKPTLVPVNDTERIINVQPPDKYCVKYYSPGHLAVENAFMQNFKLATTYITFNSTGREMLVNMGGEQIYLFDINSSKHINELKMPQINLKETKNKSNKCQCAQEGNGFVNNECVCFYLKKAAKFYNRAWLGDLYEAARNYLHVIKQCPDNKKAYLGLIKCLISLKWSNESQQWIEFFEKQFPNCLDSPQLHEIKQRINELLINNNTKNNRNTDSMELFKKVDEEETEQRLDSFDYDLRFIGHCNTTTDIKEANFLGEDGNYICAGSDEGIIFIWERKNCSIVRALFGDSSIVNCIQPHPSACFIASSGIDMCVKLWSPTKEDETVNPCIVNDINSVVEANQQRMVLDPFESMLVNMGYYGGYRSSTCRTC